MEKQKRYLKRVISIKIEDYLAEYITAKFKKKRNAWWNRNPIE